MYKKKPKDTSFRKIFSALIYNISKDNVWDTGLGIVSKFRFYC